MMSVKVMCRAQLVVLAFGIQLFWRYIIIPTDGLRFTAVKTVGFRPIWL